MKPQSTLSVFAAKNRRIANGKVVFGRDGDAYCLSNGVVSIKGEMCGERLAQSIEIAGRDCGSLDVLLKVADGAGGWTWPGVRSLCSISYRELDGAGVLDLVGEWWLVVDRWTIPGIAFRVHVRLTVRPGEPLFLCEIVDISNSGTKDLAVARAYISVMPPKGVEPVCVKQPTDEENAAAWDAGGGFAIGLQSEDEDVQKLSFWVDAASRCPHADCGFSMPGGKDLVLRPGCSAKLIRPMNAVVFLQS
jgi:hypothetical protein